MEPWGLQLVPTLVDLSVMMSVFPLVEQLGLSLVRMLARWSGLLLVRQSEQRSAY